MYERVASLLEAELLRMTGDESIENHKEHFSSSSSILGTRPETNPTEKTISEPSLLLIPQPPLEESFDTKSSSIRRGRDVIVYDEDGNPWNAEELERKEKNPYRWFIEKQREKQQVKELTQDEEATTAMVNFPFSS